ncbi:hypothetical protein GLOTRDRAFT_139578 [Gloeophyllum trabeum ATCC 11539]|uniref:Sodium/calcium exchanger membrane region domain-containing protein n=1 Tax=Gloeophyllum trabeum (strain ATCC 11539 / FP-39264 / Madison 617) TaxID=670483 RepID=S7RNA6_GLOTA|nr:uncharacterized protein GLOTRDRAFT_139578 [Gloeophyllum trabeum ATCC 11539]EPQ54244.1 hypothetical protein GLOTRDRAFT_139578 [Gloeophyllum trabeum ATCC 11539]
MCFFAGGLRFTEQGFDPTATHVQSSLLIISVSAVLLPCAYHFTIGRASEKIFDEQKVDLLRMSHGVSIILLLTYASYLLFQLYSHTHLYQDRLKKSMPHSRVVDLPKSSPSTVTLKDINEPQVLRKDTDTMYCCSVRSRRSFSLSNTGSTSDVDLTGEDSATVVGRDSDTIASRGAVRAPDVDPTVRLVQSYYADDRQTIVVLDEKADEKRIEHSDSRQSGVRGTNPTTADEDRPTDVEHSERTDKHPQLSWLMTLALLTAVTVMVSVNADQLVESMDGISTHISKTWIALILLPAVGSIAECVTAINTSVKDELTLSISVAVGSTVQTALFVIPFIVLLGWVLNKPLALLFDPFESVVLYISVHTMSSVVQDGKSNWLEGVILMCLYFIIAVSFWFYPGSDVSETLAICT